MALVICFNLMELHRLHGSHGDWSPLKKLLNWLHGSNYGALDDSEGAFFKADTKESLEHFWSSWSY